MRLVILQPFYLPYSGVFELVRLSDVFVFYDDVQFVAQNWQCRNRVKTANGPVWLTVPVQRRHGQRIDEVVISDRKPWARKHWRTIEQAYRKAGHFHLLDEHLRPLLERDWSTLAELNIATTLKLSGLLGVSARFERSSALGVPGRASERVLRHCLELGATRYLSGPSARAYLDEASFAERGVTLEYLAFDHPVYRQLHGAFVPSLSAVDLIANEGPDASAILTGCGRPVPAGQYAQVRP